MWIGEYMWCDKKKQEDEIISVNDEEWYKVLEKVKSWYYNSLLFVLIFEHYFSWTNSPKATK